MKILKRSGLVLLLALLVLVPAPGAFRHMQVQAAQNGLVKKGSDYYYFKKNKKVKNVWKTLKVEGKKYRFYFGSKGKAYRAKKLYKNACNVKLFKIRGKKYGFDSSAHVVAAGTYVNDAYQLFVFGKKGVYDAAKTKKLRSALKAGKISKGIRNKVVSKLGKPLSVRLSDSCNAWNMTDSFTDVELFYSHFEVFLTRNDRTKEYLLENFYPV